jgi:hypothetical protein
MEGLISGIAIIVFGVVITGIILITMDKQKEWEQRNKK